MAERQLKMISVCCFCFTGTLLSVKVKWLMKWEIQHVLSGNVVHYKAPLKNSQLKLQFGSYSHLFIACPYVCIG